MLLWLPSSGFATEEIRFLAISDIHFDPFIACYKTKGPCPLIQSLQQAPASQWPRILSSYHVDSPAYRQDTNYTLLHYALNKAKTAAADHQVQFVLVLGDMIGHEYRLYFRKYGTNYSRANYHAFVRKTFEFITNELAKSFPEKSVYMVIGNNDSYSGDYGYYPRTNIYSDLASQWSRLVKDPHNRAAMQQQFSRAGYYAINLTPKTKLIVLNSVLFSNKANGRGVDEAAKIELNWLQDELLSSQKKGQKAFIAMHIPPGIDIYATLKYRLFRMLELWKLPDAERYETLLKQFAPNIEGIFAGHLHHNLLQSLTLSNHNNVPMAGIPSISPFFGNNPGFNVYVFSEETGQLESVKDYSYPLSQISAT